MSLRRTTMPQSRKGQLLVSSPKLRDPNFYRTVALLVQHDEKGCLGLILNRPMSVTVKAAWAQLSTEPCEFDGVLNQGGPCEGVLMALHGDAAASDSEVTEGVYFSASKDSIERLVATPGDHVKLFAGYAGWSAGQLENEISEGAWLTAPATVEQIFNPSRQLWEELIRQIGRTSLLQWIDPKIVPDDPSVN